MSLLEILLGGTATVALFRWLTSRDKLATQALERMLSDGEARINAALARADKAELESARERERRIQAEAERDGERARRILAERERDDLLKANAQLRDRVEGLYGTVAEAVDRISALEFELGAAHKELANRSVDADRAAVVSRPAEEIATLKAQTQE